MRHITERLAVELKWSEVCDIVSKEITEILGLNIPCRAVVTGIEYWNITFGSYRLSLPKLRRLLQAVQATSEDWGDSMPDEGSVDVPDIGMRLSERLIGRQLGLAWQHHLITEDSLWLVGVTDAPKPKSEQNSGSNSVQDVTDNMEGDKENVD